MSVQNSNTKPNTRIIQILLHLVNGFEEYPNTVHIEVGDISYQLMHITCKFNLILILLYIVF